MDALMRPGVSLELARHRAATLRNVRYLLELDVTAQDSAPGRVSVTVERAAGAGDLVLDFRGPSLGAVTANGETVTDGEWKNGHLRIPARWLRDGENTVVARASPRASRRRGPASSASTTDGRRHLPLHAAGARRRQPALSLVRPAGPQGALPLQHHRAARVEGAGQRPRPARGERRDGARGHFDETEPISTYLAAFAAGPWHTWTELAGGRRPADHAVRPRQPRRARWTRTR